jgi:putative glycosyltransferase (TIGR04372 family)
VTDAAPLLVIGTAKPEHIERFLAKPEATEATLLASVRDKARFSDRLPRTRFFSGALNWFNPGLFKAFWTLRPKQVVIVCGLAYDHENVVEAVRIASRMLGCGGKLSLYVGETVLAPPKTSERSNVWLEIPKLAFSAVLAGLLWLLRPLVTVRVGRIYAHRLGHLAMDCEIYLCERDLGACPPRTFDIFYPKPGFVANEHLLAMFGRRMRIWPLARWVKAAVDLFSLNARHELVMTTHQVAYTRDVRCLMRHAPAHLRFTFQEKKRGLAGLARLGVPEGIPHVCLFGRDSLYLQSVTGALGDGDFQRPRNMDIQTFRETALALVERGYAVIRMGSLVNEPLDVVHPLVFDYATSDIRDPFLDIFIAATCRFFVGAPSGLVHIPMIFRIPCVYVNLVRLEFMHFCDPRDITIFKRFRRVADGRHLSVTEVIGSGLGRRPIEDVARDTSLEIIDNTTADILEAVLEMHERLEEKFCEESQDEALQYYFRSLIPLGQYNTELNSRVAAAFLRRYRDTLFPGLSLE